MNEFDAVRKAFPPDPGEPSPTAKASSRSRLRELAVARGSAGSARPGRRSLSGSGWWRSPGRVGVALTACGALAAVAVLGLPLLTNGGASGPGAVPGPGGVAGPDAAAPTASQFLLAAAAREDAKPASTGRYFRVRVLSVRATHVMGMKRLPDEFRVIGENWYPADPKEMPWIGHVDLGYWPYAIADHEGWLTANPMSWQFPGKKMARAGTYATIGQLPAYQSKYPNFPLGLRSLADYEKLPADPAKLRARLAEPYRKEHPRAIDLRVFEDAGRLLSEAPASPKLRAAAYRVLAALPGITIRQNVKDPLGRVGTELRLNHRIPSRAPYEHLVSDGQARYVIDGDTGAVLSSYSDNYVGQWKPPARKWNFSVVLFSGWSDDKPTKPSREIK